MVVGIVIGGIVPLFAVPMFEKFIQNHEGAEIQDATKKITKPIN